MFAVGAAGGAAAGAARTALPAPARALAAVGLHLPVDLLLHAVRMAHVAEARLAVLARRLDLERARTDQAVDDPLVEVDVVHAVSGISTPCFASTPVR